MRLKLKFAFAVAAAVLACGAASVHAQSPVVGIVGSSAQWLELGQASSIAPTNPPAGYGTVCVWDGGSFTATDNRGTGAQGFPFTDSGAAWVQWNSGTGTCAVPAGTWSITYFINTDSVVGNRCFFAGCTVTTGYTGTSSTCFTGASTFTGISEQTQICGTVFNAINGTKVTAAATDIRPEDAKFAVNRALTPCGTPIQDTVEVNVGGAETATPVYTQYLGIGDQNSGADSQNRVGNKIAEGQLSTKKFNVLQFNITGNDPFTNTAVPSYSVIELGAVPVVVFVNPSDGTGFGSLQLSNIDRAILAGYLDGTYGSTSDAFLVSGGAAPTSGSNTFLREYMSGTYNTMEYSIPNSVQVHSSQEVGLNAQLANNNGFIFPPYNCTGSGATATFALSSNAQSGSLSNPLYENYLRPSGETSIRGREIGTGDEIKAVLATAGLGACTPTSTPACTSPNPTQPNVPGKDSLGYAFWSAANFNGARAGTGKYLSVDGIDPLEQDWQDGLIPNTVYDNLGDVSLAHVKDGSYPIYSILRLVAGTTATSTINTLVSNAIKFLSPTQPDFVHVSQLPIVRSHFAPPGVLFPGCTALPCQTSVSNGSSASSPEAGGDVGGLALTLQSEFDYIADTNNQSGNTGMRQ